MKSKKEFVRNNEALKAPDFTEFVSKEEYEFRVKEIIRCKKDIFYFAEKYYNIISLDKGQHIIKLFSKQRELLGFLKDNKRCVILSSRQTAKTTTYSIYALWTVLFNQDKHVLVCANKAATSLEIVGRIRLAYELIPNWLKPGIVEYNKGRIKLSNNSTIEGISTSPSTARGKFVNILLLDEFSFVPANICLTEDMQITVRNKESGQIEKIPFEMLFQKL